MKKTHELRRKLIAWFVVLSMILSDAAPIFPGNAALADGEESVLTCGLTEHTHTEACYEDVLTCGKEASDPKFINTFKVHHHSDDCRNAAGELICGYVEDEYYHTHNEYCRNAEGKLVCGLETRKPHDHTDECYRTDRILICENNDQGHTHTDGGIRPGTLRYHIGNCLSDLLIGFALDEPDFRRKDAAVEDTDFSVLIPGYIFIPQEKGHVLILAFHKKNLPAYARIRRKRSVRSRPRRKLFRCLMRAIPSLIRARSMGSFSVRSVTELSSMTLESPTVRRMISVPA